MKILEHVQKFPGGPVVVPLLPLAVLGLSGGDFDYTELLTLLIPFILGIILSNLDDNIAKMMKPGTATLLPFLGFCFGASVNLLEALHSTGTGLLLLILYVIVTMVPQLAADRLLLKRPGYAALSSCTIGGTALVIPAIIADAMPIHSPYVNTAVAQLAFAMIFSCLLTPFLTGLWVKLVK